MSEMTCGQRLRSLNAIRRTVANDNQQAIAPRALDNLHVLCWLSAEGEAVRPSGATSRQWRFAERAR